MNQLNQINNYTYSLLGELLFETVPEFKSFFDSNFSRNESVFGGYSFMNEFALRLTEEMQKDISSNFVLNSFSYINTIGESENLEVLNVLRVGILEILYTAKPSLRNHVLSLSNKKVQILFNNFDKFYV